MVHGHRMRYVMKPKLLSLRDSYTVANEAGEDVFVVQGKAFALRNELSFRDLNGKELAFIQEKLSWGPRYEIYRDDALYATVKKELTFFKPSLSVHLATGDDLEARGDLSNHEYTISRPDRPIAWISKAWFKLSDTYGVEVGEGQDPILILAITAVIDLVCNRGA
jgi:uncharacterized protein YxjI